MVTQVLYCTRLLTGDRDLVCMHACRVTPGFGSLGTVDFVFGQLSVCDLSCLLCFACLFLAGLEGGNLREGGTGWMGGWAVGLGGGGGGLDPVGWGR